MNNIQGLNHNQDAEERKEAAPAETFAGLGIRLDGTGIGTKKDAGQEAAAVAQ